MSIQAVNTTLCYIRENGSTLMLQRTTHDAMHGKWIVPGGKFEPGETPEECVMREVNEETGLELLEVRPRGILTFVRGSAEKVVSTCTCFVFESHDFHGDVLTKEDHALRWVIDEQILDLDLPASDHIFLPWIYEGTRFFSAKLSNGLKHVAFYK